MRYIAHSVTPILVYHSVDLYPGGADRIAHEFRGEVEAFSSSAFSKVVGPLFLRQTPPHFCRKKKREDDFEVRLPTVVHCKFQGREKGPVCHEVHCFQALQARIAKYPFFVLSVLCDHINPTSKEIASPTPHY